MKPKYFMGLLVLMVAIVGLVLLNKELNQKKILEMPVTVQTVEEQSLLVVDEQQQVYRVPTENRVSGTYREGDKLVIYYEGEVLETHPAQFSHVISIKQQR
ncbi:hypothetical protein ACWN8B_03420 [Vagococcus zengguangii]|uniref:DUF3221 domain-containing protein n=1 Tax=Vagococcus zengguangii TaxID=2571750 RepID=A0A4D7CX80_9ENTE|nr:hypothetical protein [Vagococcus zengguangii]QCI87001.1 hypothetical protein FA707_08500 [Vagococcus zengguangii]